MNILIGITYYLPNTSGLTIYAKRLAEGLVKKGHQVTILTSRYTKDLPREEITNGIRIIRTPVLVKIGKGVILPFLPLEILSLIRNVEVVNCHLPQYESFIFAFLGKLFGKKVILTHHTDLSGWSGVLNRISELNVWLGQLLAGVFSDHIVPYTKDYADNSWYLNLFKNKLIFILPPILKGKIDEKLKNELSAKIGKVKYIIGYSGRIARQKGIPFLLETIPLIKNKLNSFKIVFAGPYNEVIGEKYYNEIQSLINKYKESLYFTGNIPEEKMATFYSMCSILVLPSDDRLESFGLVQVEAMLNGCPVIATDLPGVRLPIKLTGMGKIVKPRNSIVLSDAIVQLIKKRNNYLVNEEKIKNIFNYDSTILSYEKIFK